MLNATDRETSLTPIETLRRQAGARPEVICFAMNGQEWSYRRLLCESRRVASAFLACGVRSGDRIALHVPNGPELVMAYYACFIIGAIAAPLNIRFKAPELLPLLDRLAPAIYLGTPLLHAEIADHVGSLVGSAFVTGKEGNGSARPWHELIAKADQQPLSSFLDGDAVAILFTTSGTTGQPKLVALTAAKLAAMASTPLHPDLDGGQVELIVMPMVHMLGLYCLLHVISIGGTAVLGPRDPDRELDAIASHRCTRLLATPAIFVELTQRQRWRPRDVGSLRICGAGGDVLPPTLARDFANVFGIPLRSGLGITEAAWMFTLSMTPGTVGKVMPDTEVRLVDDAGCIVVRGTPGELLFRGPVLASGYWDGPGQLRDVCRDGWLWTGDLLVQDNEGAYRYVARKKHLIVSGGHNVVPAEVEDVLRTHPAVGDAAVFGIPDDVLGQRVAALVRLHDASDAANPDEIRAFAAARLADYKVPVRMRLVDALPTNALGKVDRRALPSFLDGHG